MRFTIRTGAAYAVGCSLVLTGLLGRPAVLRGADDPAAPSAYAMLPGGEELLGDVDYLLNLTDTTEKKQKKVLREYLEVFLIGVNAKLPSEIDVLFGEKGQRSVWIVPVANFKNFRDNNIKSILTPSVRQTAPGLYKLGRGRPGDFNGFMAYAAPYARIGELRPDVTQAPADPQAALKPLLARHVVLGVDIRNQKNDPESAAKRRQFFQAARKDLLTPLKKDKGETTADFDLRKKALDLQMGEFEWFFAESEHFQTSLTLDQSKGLGRVDLDMTPLPGTPLAKAMEQLATRPSYFANIEKSADPILSGRLNHPLTDVRKKTASAVLALVRDRLKSHTADDAKRSADEKAASDQLIDRATGVIQSGVDAGLADGFIDVHNVAPGKRLLLGGVRTADGSKIGEILNLMPKAGAAEKVTLDTAEESGVKIHLVQFSKNRYPEWNDFIGADTLYVGSSKDVVWCAAGQGALDALKSAIKKAAKPAPAGAEKAPWGELIVRLKPWLDSWSSNLSKRKNVDKYRKIALAALQPADDLLTARLTRDANKIVGEIVAQQGLLRFAGKVAADFSKENLDTDSGKTPKSTKR